MPQRKHVHCHPSNKTDGKYWAIEFASDGCYKSPLMGWTRATMDSYSNVKMSFGKLSDAVAYAETMGWGYDISYPQHNQRWHVKKNYADNFKWKGQPKPEESYD